eukprot:5761698-Pleurochrysis_carterae.AAC.1
MRRNASSKSGRPLASGSRSSAPHASCASSTRPKANTPPPTPLPASTWATPSSSPSAIMALGTSTAAVSAF